MLVYSRLILLYTLLYLHLTAIVKIVNSLLTDQILLIHILTNSAQHLLHLLFHRIHLISS